MIRFLVDPSAAKEAVLSGRCLLVEVESPARYRVTVVSRKGAPITPSDEQSARAA